MSDVPKHVLRELGSIFGPHPCSKCGGLRPSFCPPGAKPCYCPEREYRERRDAEERDV